MDINEQKQFIEHVINQAQEATQTDKERSAVAFLTAQIETAQARIVEWASKAALDPSYAIQWGEQVVVDQNALESYIKVLQMWSATDRDDRLQLWAEHLHDMLLDGSLEDHSTSLLSRGVGEAKVVATRLIYKHLRSTLKYLAGE